MSAKNEKTFIVTDVNELLNFTEKISNSYHKLRIQKDVDLFNEVSKFHPCTISSEITSYDNDEGEIIFYIENIFVFLTHSRLKICIRYDDYRKKYNIFTLALPEYKNLSYDYMNHIAKRKESPKKIGVLNAKKINDWIKYYEEIDEIYTAKISDCDNKVDEFKNKLSKLPVVWYPDNKSGYIENNGLRYQFEIYQDGFISESIRITGASSLETFLNLTNIA